MSALLRRYPDPETSSDPQIRDLLAQLAALPVAPAPRVQFRDELRAQLVAITPRIIAENQSKTAASPDAPRAANARSARRRIPVGRVLGIAASIVTVFALILGGAVWLSQKAVPGDTLYGLKRASERVELKLDTNDTDRAADHLKFAQRRVDEVKTLLGRTSATGTGPQAAGVSAETTKLIVTALSSSTDDVKTAWTLLKAQADRTASGQHLDTMTKWAPGQLARLKALIAPAGAIQAQIAQAQKWVLTALSLSTQELRKYAKAPGTPGGGSSGAPSIGTPKSGSATSTPKRGTSTTKPGTSNGTSVKTGTGAKPSTKATTPGGVLRSLPVQLPTTPTVKLPKAPVSVSKSCVKVAGVPLGNCSGH